MKVLITTVLHDLDGIPLRDAKLVDSEGRVLRPERDFTLRKACTEALQAMNLTGDTQDGEERFKRYLLALKIMADDSPDLSADEVVKLKRLIGLSFSSTVVGRAYELLDPTPSKPV